MPVFRVAAGVIVRGEDVLVCRRRATDRHPLQWEFPGGKLEPGETFAQGLVRELREELGVETRCAAELHRLHHHYGNGVEVEVAFFRAHILDGEPRNLNFHEMRWCRRAEMAVLDFVEADRDFVARLAAGLVPLEGARRRRSS
jgi:8-oxo-dGTP diphosphatase